MTELIPAIPEDLLLWLERTYPPRCAMLGETVQEVFMYAGRVAVVQDLRAHFDEQNQRQE